MKMNKVLVLSLIAASATLNGVQTPTRPTNQAYASEAMEWIKKNSSFFGSAKLCVKNVSRAPVDINAGALTEGVNPSTYDFTKDPSFKNNYTLVSGQPVTSKTPGMKVITFKKLTNPSDRLKIRHNGQTRWSTVDVLYNTGTMQYHIVQLTNGTLCVYSYDKNGNEVITHLD